MINDGLLGAMSVDLNQQEDELKKKEKEAGQLPSMSPWDAAAKGGNPDQAKMIGAAPPRIEDDLSRAVRQQSSRRGESSTPEQAVGAKLSEAASASLGTLAGRIDQLVLSKYNTLNAAPIQQVTSDQITAYAKEQAEKEGKTPDQWMRDNQKALEDKFKVDLNGFLKSKTEGMKSKAVEVFQPEMQTELKTLGIEIGPETTISQALEMIEGRLAEKDQAQVDTMLEEMATASPARRAEIMDMLEGLGYSGQIAYETELDNLQEMIKGSAEVEIAGEKMTVEQALESDSVNRLIEEYLASGGSTTWSKDPQYAGLVSFIEKNKNAITALNESVTSQTTDISAKAGEREGGRELFRTTFGDEALRSVFGEKYSPDMDPEVLKRMIPSWEAFTDPGGRLAGLRKEDPAMWQSFLKKSAAELKYLGVHPDSKPEDKAAFENMMAMNKFADGLANLDEFQDPARFIAKTLGLTDQELQNRLRVNAVSGKKDPFLSSIDRDGDGKVDKKGDLASRFTTMLDPHKSKNLPKLDAPIDEAELSFANKFMNDGKIDKNDLRLAWGVPEEMDRLKKMVAPDLFTAMTREITDEKNSGAARDIIAANKSKDVQITRMVQDKKYMDMSIANLTQELASIEKNKATMDPYIYDKLKKKVQTMLTSKRAQEARAAAALGAAASEEGHGDGDGVGASTGNEGAGIGGSLGGGSGS